MLCWSREVRVVCTEKWICMGYGLVQDLHACMCYSGAVLYAYEQCLLCFGHCVEIWYEAALYLQRASETGVSVLPHSLYHLATILH